MPDAPDVDLEAVEAKVKETVENHGGTFGKAEIVPVAFGLKSLKVSVSVDESKGSPDDMETALRALDGVQSCEVISASRALG